MNRMSEAWDYLVITASHAGQASAYEKQLRLRQPSLPQARQVMVVEDPGGRRIGSGGSTMHCLSLVIERELGRRRSSGDPERILRRLRILIVHAGGDSKRLPAYGPCGKLFVPVPGEAPGAASTLFDRLIPHLLALPPSPEGAGQVVVASGDALTRFDPAAVAFDQAGMVALACSASPEEASRHGVYCVDGNGSLRLYLQKPALEVQSRTGAISPDGRSLLDIGVMSFDAASAARLIETFEPISATIVPPPLDLYREICCALGSEATPAHYRATVSSSGSAWEDAALLRFFQALHGLPLHVCVLPKCSFLHFGSTRQLIESGLILAQQAGSLLRLNTEAGPGGAISGVHSWVEGCRLNARLSLGGNNVVVGADVEEPLCLPAGACLDVLSGWGRRGHPKWFVRCYGINDSFKESAVEGGTLCGRPLAEWIEMAGVAAGEIWDADIPPCERSLWNARVFPAETGPAGYRRWLWMFTPQAATPEEKQAFRAAERYSAAEIALASDQDAFYQRRASLRACK